MDLKNSAKNLIKRGISRVAEWHLPSISKQGGEIKKLLIIRIDAIGDLVIFSDVLPYYRELYPRGEWHITLLCNRVCVSLAERCPHIDELIVFDPHRFTRDLLYRRKLLKQIRYAGSDIAVYPTYSREPFGDELIRLSGATERIGYDGDCNNISPEQKANNDKHYTLLIPSRAGIVLETERNQDMVRALGARVDGTACSTLALSKEDEEKARCLLIDNNVCDDKPFVVFFPGAGWVRRQWPVERFAELAKRIDRRYGLTSVICGGPGEEGLAEQLLELNDGTPLINLVGKTDLVELAGIIKKSKILISNETGAVHLAAAVHTPSVCILGGGHFGRFVPYSVQSSIAAVYRTMDCFGCDWECYDTDENECTPCIKRVDVDQAMEKVTMILSSLAG